MNARLKGCTVIADTPCSARCGCNDEKTPFAHSHEMNKNSRL